jgi:hypothetical protein
MVKVAEASGIPPGLASKLFGVCNFLETGTFHEQAFFEYIESGANWAGEISREGLQGPWAEKNGCACVDATVPTEFLLLPTRALILLCEFL